MGRFTLRGWFAGIYVARARGDATRVASYRSAALAIADPDALPLDSRFRQFLQAYFSEDAEATKRALLESALHQEYRGEGLVELLFEREADLPEEFLDEVERAAAVRTVLVSKRLRLARALRHGPDEVREAVRELEAADLHADAARALALLAIRWDDREARAEAGRRLASFGDREYLSRLEEGTGA